MVYYLFVAVLSFFVAVEATRNNSLRECDATSAAKVAHLFGLRAQLSRREEDAVTFIREIKERKIALNKTLDIIEKLGTVINSISTPEIEELEMYQRCNANIPKDCCEIKRVYPSARSGLYAIKDPCSNIEKLYTTARLTVYCDMETDGGGWIVIQRRNASMGWVKFTRNFEDYEKGFGEIDGEYWIGLKTIYELTNRENFELEATLWNNTQDARNWKYSWFRISSSYGISALRSSSRGSYPFFNYNRFSGYQKFKTYDQYSGQNCGYQRQSGWWYYNDNCDEYANPNGLHQHSNLPGADRVGERLVWRASSNGYIVYKHSEIKIRPQNCHID